MSVKDELVDQLYFVQRDITKKSTIIKLKHNIFYTFKIIKRIIYLICKIR